MANRRPTPLKDEPVVPLDELQEQITKLIAVVNSLVERTAAEKHQTDDRLQNAISMSVIKRAGLAGSTAKEIRGSRQRQDDRQRSLSENSWPV